ncbi:hypothetical protein BU24DRAFT_414490 [Aaosphaeria arxii CBS 175.79]|uniref:Alpha-1,3-mannosyltransferase n=1 Tax=Aaosphaeria arxii CBS 175.79 TaxID=1450172 RepID=A0A6A5XAW4_9PLEO|nr:uncharacterized protein BU24DRAFT_414490 [Aaosphaeria arxii CBS 175.79]KAF2010050.1 hypothetical protein BU24DRAFT_414490 [Aaosphaeria arxii CBS 175.79]
MPPHLHPRSRMTMSLFTTTLAICFIVVATPHLLPCPVDNRAFADSADPQALQRRRRRRRAQEEACNDTMREDRKIQIVTDDWARPKRECPVPKPGGLIGQVLGIKSENEDEMDFSILEEVNKQRIRQKASDE